MRRAGRDLCLPRCRAQRRRVAARGAPAVRLRPSLSAGRGGFAAARPRRRCCATSDGAGGQESCNLCTTSCSCSFVACLLAAGFAAGRRLGGTCEAAQQGSSAAQTKPSGTDLEWGVCVWPVAAWFRQHVGAIHDGAPPAAVEPGSYRPPTLRDTVSLLRDVGWRPPSLLVQWGQWKA